MNSLRLLIALPLLLAGCQITTFATPPLAADAGCDPALVGDWRDHDDDAPADAAAEMVLHIDAACRLQVDEHKRDGIRRGDGVQLWLGRHDGQRYAWVDANWLMQRFDEEHRFPAGDIVLLRFAVDGGRLRIWHADHKAIAHAVIDDAFDGEVVYDDDDLYVRLTGAADPGLLQREHFFDAEPVLFRALDAD